MDICGQNKLLVWLEDKQEWATIYTQSNLKTIVTYMLLVDLSLSATTIPLSLCNCMRGFSVRSPEDWGLEGGCIRNMPLDCSAMNHRRTATTDKFYIMTGVTLPAEANIIGSVGSTDQCEQACLNNCSCTAYSYSNGGRCSQCVIMTCQTSEAILMAQPVMGKFSTLASLPKMQKIGDILRERKERSLEL